MNGEAVSEQIILHADIFYAKLYFAFAIEPEIENHKYFKITNSMHKSCESYLPIG